MLPIIGKAATWYIPWPVAVESKKPLLKVG